MKRGAIMATTTVTIPSKELTLADSQRTQNKNPMPPIGKAADSSHESDAVIQQTTKSAGNGSHGKEDRDPKSQFISFIEICQVENHTRKIARFRCPEEKTGDNETREIGDKSHHSHDLKTLANLRMGHTIPQPKRRAGKYKDGRICRSRMLEGTSKGIYLSH